MQRKWLVTRCRTLTMGPPHGNGAPRLPPLPPQEFYSQGCSGALFLRPQYAICSAKLELKLRHRDLTHYVSKAVRTLVRNKHSDMLNTLTNTTFPILNYITQFFLYGMA